MFTLRDRILIRAPIERCFALSCSLAVVQRELGMHPVASRTGEQRTPAGRPPTRTQGLVSGGDTVRWEGWQLGFPNFHVSLIVPETWDPPRFFQDRMLAGRFRSFEHDHRFTPLGDGVLLDDEVRFTMPLAWAGWMVGRTVLVPHIGRLMRRRFHLLKRLAEGDEWRQFLPG